MYQYFLMDGKSNTFPVTKPIKRKPLSEVFVKRKDNGLWEQLWDNAYDVINNSIVVNQSVVDVDFFDVLEARVADNEDELGMSPSYLNIIIKYLPEIIRVANNIDIINEVADNMLALRIIANNLLIINTVAQDIDSVRTVAFNIDSVNQVASFIGDVTTVAGIQAEVVAVANNETNVNLVGSNIDNVNAVGSNISAVTTVADNIDDIENVLPHVTNIETVANNIGSVNDVATDIANVNTVATNITSVITVSDNIDDVIAAYTRARTAEAEALTAQSAAAQPYNELVRDYYYDQPTDSILYNEVQHYSALHYAIEARASAAGLRLVGLWTSDNCAMPPAPDPADVPDGESANGWYYIVNGVTNNSGCPELTVGDWIVWFGDDPLTDDTIEGQWYIINWTFDWSAIQNVPDNVVNALNRNGDTMLGELTCNSDFAARKYFRVKNYDGTDDMMRSFFRDAVWNISALDAGGNTISVTLDIYGKVKVSLAPTESDDVTRKDYVDNNFLALASIAQTDGLLYRGDLPDAADLNNYINAGLYHQPQNAYASNGSNYPEPLAGMLTVATRSAMIYQTYEIYGSATINSDNRTWERRYYSSDGTWSSWTKVLNSASTIDADTLDGKDSTEFALTTDLNGKANYAEYDSLDLNTHSTQGVFRVTNPINAPSGVLRATYTFTGDANNATESLDTGTDVWLRERVAGTIEAWKAVGGIENLYHNDLNGRDEPNQHPIASITDLDTTLAAKAPLASPAFTGTPTAPTPTQSDGIATMGYVDGKFSDSLPIGVIVMWSGTTIPSGWALCDGLNNTPNLVGRFVYGGQLVDIGNTGGSANAVAVGHTHNVAGTTVENGLHSHQTQGYKHITTGSSGDALSRGHVPSDPAETNNPILEDGNHSHTFDVTSSNNNPSEDGTGKNMPPYYTLAYIMKVS